MPAEYFFDTYALIGILTGNKAYEPYRGLPIFTEKYNIYELLFYLLRDYSERKAREVAALLNPNLLTPELEDLMHAASFKHRHSQRRFSYVDCLGYILSQKHGLTFLTGDRQFRGLEGVEFVPVRRE